MRDQRPITEVGTTASNDQTVETKDFDDPGTITGAKIVTHSGQEYALRYFASVIRDGSETSLWESFGSEYLAGDGEDFDLPLRFTFSEDDVLKLRVENVSQYQYHHNIVIEVDYETGLQSRVVEAVRGAI